MILSVKHKTDCSTHGIDSKLVILILCKLLVYSIYTIDNTFVLKVSR